MIFKEEDIVNLVNYLIVESSNSYKFIEQVIKRRNEQIEDIYDKLTQMEVVLNRAISETIAKHKRMARMKQELNEDGSVKASKWIGSDKYVGDWKNNKKDGFGIQYYENGNKYEGGWVENKRHGQGTLWAADGKNKLRREYTGDWERDRKKGRGTMFFKTGDRYDGLWFDDKPHGQGRMIYSNGDVYQGMWSMGKRSGYGVLTKRCGDHFEGHWVNDMREGQGSYFYSLKNQIFVGEWVEDTPKTGVYSQVQDPTTRRPEREKHFTDPYILPSLRPIELQNPTSVLEQSMEMVRKHRSCYRARFIPVDELYSKEELLELQKQFHSAMSQSQTISEHNLFALLLNMNFALDGTTNDNIENSVRQNLRRLKPDYVQDQVDCDLFVRLVAIILQQSSLEQQSQTEQHSTILDQINEQKRHDQEQEQHWYNMQRKS